MTPSRSSEFWGRSPPRVFEARGGSRPRTECGAAGGHAGGGPTAERSSAPCAGSARGRQVCVAGRGRVLVGRARVRVRARPARRPVRCARPRQASHAAGGSPWRTVPVSFFPGNCYMAVRNRMPINAAMIVTEESSLTTISLSVATSNSAGIAHGERCRATLHCR